jgi:hypothetical protein
MKKEDEATRISHALNALGAMPRGAIRKIAGEEESEQLIKMVSDLACTNIEDNNIAVTRETLIVFSLGYAAGIIAGKMSTEDSKLLYVPTGIQLLIEKMDDEHIDDILARAEEQVKQAKKGV